MNFDKRKWAGILLLGIVGTVLLSFILSMLAPLVVAALIAYYNRIKINRKEAIFLGIFTGLVFIVTRLIVLSPTNSVTSSAGIAVVAVIGIVLGIVGALVGQRSGEKGSQTEKEKQAISMVKSTKWVVYLPMIGIGILMIYLGFIQLRNIQNGTFVSSAGPMLYYGMMGLGILLIVLAPVFWRLQSKAINKVEKEMPK